MIPATPETLLTIACMIAGGIGLCSWWAYGLGYAEGKLAGFEAGRDSVEPFTPSDPVRVGLENW